MTKQYLAYLKSTDWQQKRRKKLNRKGRLKRRCAICGSRDNLDIHHLIYRTPLSAARQNDLRVLCRRCHGLTHDLIRSGVLKFGNRKPNRRFTLTFRAVHAELLKQEAHAQSVALNKLDDWQDSHLSSI